MQRSTIATLSRMRLPFACLLALAACSSTEPVPTDPPDAAAPRPSASATTTVAPPADAESPPPPRDAGLADASDAGLTLLEYPRRGSATDDARPPQGPGLLLGGGGADVDAAFVFAHDLVVGGPASGADVVVLRATGTDAYDP